MVQSPEMIRRYYERTRVQRENKVDFRTATRSVMKEYRQKIREVQNDPYIPDDRRREFD